jgi:hypothetical protein
MTYEKNLRFFKGRDKTAQAAVFNILAAVFEARHGISDRAEEFCPLRTRTKHLRNNVSL